MIHLRGVPYPPDFTSAAPLCSTREQPVRGEVTTLRSAATCPECQRIWDGRPVRRERDAKERWDQRPASRALVDVEDESERRFP